MYFNIIDHSFTISPQSVWFVSYGCWKNLPQTGELKNNRNLLSQAFWGQKSRINVSEGLVLSGGSEGLSIPCLYPMLVASNPWYSLCCSSITSASIFTWPCPWYIPVSQVSLCLFFFKFFYFLKKKLINLFLAALGLRCCSRAFSSCGGGGLLFIAVHRLLIAVVSLVAEDRL